MLHFVQLAPLHRLDHHLLQGRTQSFIMQTRPRLDPRRSQSLRLLLRHCQLMLPPFPVQDSPSPLQLSFQCRRQYSPRNPMQRIPRSETLFPFLALSLPLEALPSISSLTLRWVGVMSDKGRPHYDNAPPTMICLTRGRHVPAMFNFLECCGNSVTKSCLPLDCSELLTSR